MSIVVPHTLATTSHVSKYKESSKLHCTSFQLTAMGFTLWITLTSICTAVGGYVWLLLQQSFPNDGFRPLQRPGPILLAAADGANLDGLTLIRAVKLPTLKIMLPGIGSVIIQNSTSEMVFKTLRIRDFSIKSEDASIGETKVMGYVDAEFTGLSSVKTEIVRAALQCDEILKYSLRYLINIECSSASSGTRSSKVHQSTVWAHQRISWESFCADRLPHWTQCQGTAST